MSDVSEIQAALAGFWAATGSTPPPELSVVDDSAPADVSAFRTSLAASTSVAAVQAAVAELTGSPVAPIDRSLALAGFTTHTLVNGESPPKWASLSGFYRTGDDRFVQLHCNFPHHAAGAAARLGVAEDRAEFEQAILGWDAFDLESALIDDGMICAAVPNPPRVERSPQAQAVANLPIASMTPLALGDPSPTPGGPAPSVGGASAGLLPSIGRARGWQHPRQPGCRCLARRCRPLTARRGLCDQHRCRQTKHLLGPPNQRRSRFVRESGAGCRHRYRCLPTRRPGAVRLRTGGDCSYLDHDLGGADLCIRLGGAVGREARFRLDRAVDHWHRVGGMEMSGADSPTHLPVQVLDYATGLFAAASAIRSIHRNRTVGGSSNTKLSLIRTRNWLVGLGGPVQFEPGTVTPSASQLATINSDFGEVELVRPFAGEWQHGPQHLGTAQPVWL